MTFVNRINHKVNRQWQTRAVVQSLCALILFSRAYANVSESWFNAGLFALLGTLCATAAVLAWKLRQTIGDAN